MKSVNVQPRAEAEAEESAAWYEAEQPGLGIELLLELDAAIEGAAETRLAYAPVFLEARCTSFTTETSWKSSPSSTNSVPVRFGSRECGLSSHRNRRGMDAAALSLELLSMAAEDLRVREQLASAGSLFENYDPRMREVHERNAERLSEIVDAHGWPGRSLVGEEATQAAWLILQHSISKPALQRNALSLLRKAAAAGEVPRVQVAMLEDRIRSNEGRGQLYGTQVDWDEHGQLSPLPIEDEGNVDARRRDIGLGPLAQHIQRKRELAVREGERPPLDWKARERDKDDWLRAVGWRT